MQQISLPRVQQVPQQVTTAQVTRDTLALSDLEPSELCFLFCHCCSFFFDVFSSSPEGSFEAMFLKNLLLQIVLQHTKIADGLSFIQKFRFGVQALHRAMGAEVDRQTDAKVLDWRNTEPLGEANLSAGRCCTRGRAS